MAARSAQVKSNLAEKLIERVAASRRLILVVGDIMVDRWVYGHLDDSQDGCHKFVQSRIRDYPGGAGNAARCLTNWAVHTELVGQFEKDRCVKTRFVDVLGDSKYICFRHDHDVHAGDGDEYAPTRKVVLEWVDGASGVLLCDYDKGFLSPDLINRVAEACRRRRIPCVADVKRGPDTYAGCITKANEAWYLRHGIASVVTRGGDSPAVSGTSVKSHLPPVKCVNHVGAGDCFAAHMTLALAYDFTMEESAAIAHSAGRVYVQRMPSCTWQPFPQEIAADMSSAE